ncbi:MAG: hypothetical protein ABH858_05820, partial [Candidatus Omnitrophota bacterium]
MKNKFFVTFMLAVFFITVTFFLAKVEAKPISHAMTSTYVVIVTHDDQPGTGFDQLGAWYYDFFTKFYGIRNVLFLCGEGSGIGSNPKFYQWKSEGIRIFNEISGIYGHPLQPVVSGRATASNVLGALRWLQNVCDPVHDTAIFVSIGHGGQVTESEDNRDADIEPDGKDGMVAYDGFSLSDGQLADELSKIKCRDMIVMISACNGGEFMYDIESAVGKNGTNVRVITTAPPDKISYIMGYDAVNDEALFSPRDRYCIIGQILNGSVLAHSGNPDGAHLTCSIGKDDYFLLPPTYPLEYSFKFHNSKYDFETNWSSIPEDNEKAHFALVD